MTAFSSFAFRASGVPSICPGPNSCERTLPDRLLDIVINVKEFGALGDGTGALLSSRYASLAAAQAVYPFVTSLSDTIDWAAIIAAWNWTTSTNRGTIFFPPGTYYVSAPIDVSLDAGVMLLTGSLGGTTIIGNFADYVIKKANPNVSNPSYVENLTIINNHATGGGIRLGGTVGAAIRNCTVVANKGINTNGDDTINGGGTALETTITNCNLSPGVNTAGSIGMVVVTNGGISNCRIIGFEKGVITWGQQGGQAFQGCYFEGNGIAFRSGMRPNGVDEFCPGSGFSGCWFKNNGTAMYLSSLGGATHIQGVRVDADETVTVYGSRPQFGIRMVGIFADFAGLYIDGQYEQAAIVVDNSATTSTYDGVSAFNTSTHSGVPWSMAAVDSRTVYTGCNGPAPVYALASLPTLIVGVNTASWSAGTTTLNMFGNMSNLGGHTIEMTVSGVTPSGYNGFFTGVVAPGGNDLTYSQSNPGSPTGSGGVAVMNVDSAMREGDVYNVNDSNVATWSANPVGGGSTHAKVRWNGSNLTVIGK